MTVYRTMLDTNIVSDLIHNPHGRAAARLVEHGATGICLSIVTACELRFGAAYAGSARLRDRVNEMLSSLDVLALDVPADREYGLLRAELRAAGTPIGPNDLFIAAHARALQVILVTHNIREFSRVRGLTLENWLE